MEVPTWMPTVKKKLRELNSEISMLQLTFGQNMQKETNAFQLIVDKEEDLAGLPQNLIASAAETAKEAGMEGKWIFTLHNPSVMPFLQYADNRDLREKIFKDTLTEEITEMNTTTRKWYANCSKPVWKKPS